MVRLRYVYIYTVDEPLLSHKHNADFSDMSRKREYILPTNITRTCKRQNLCDVFVEFVYVQYIHYYTFSIRQTLYRQLFTILLAEKLYAVCENKILQLKIITAKFLTIILQIYQQKTEFAETEIEQEEKDCKEEKNYFPQVICFINCYPET